jgi:prephenate dehydrogenase
MAVQVTIIGLGQIGASIGLALAKYSQRIVRVGNDRALEVAQQAKKIGAVDKTVVNLPAAVEEADLVILALPLDEVRETLAIIAPCLKEGAVVLDTAPGKKVVGEWACQLLPENRHYAGLTPVLGPLALHTDKAGIEGAEAELFQHGVIAITSPVGTASGALKMATDLAHVLGANPFYTDVDEVDSLMAGLHTLPQLLAAALAGATLDRPGRLEGRKLAGRHYARLTRLLVDGVNPGALTALAVMNRDYLVMKLDQVIVALQEIRQVVADEAGEDLHKHLTKLRRGRARWWSERNSTSWDESPAVEIPSSSDRMTRMVVGGFFGLGKQKDKGEDED